MTAKEPWKYPLPKKPSKDRKGYLDVSTHPPHQLYWEEHGNPEGAPVIYLHGGPGAGSGAERHGSSIPSITASFCSTSAVLAIASPTLL